jgi:hypothetical protein
VADISDSSKLQVEKLPDIIMEAKHILATRTDNVHRYRKGGYNAYEALLVTRLLERIIALDPQENQHIDDVNPIMTAVGFAHNDHPDGTHSRRLFHLRYKQGE